MNLDVFTTPMGKTQTHNMYSTMTPNSTFLKRGQQSNNSRTSRYRYPSTHKPISPQIANLSSSISKQYREQTKVVLPGIKKEKGYMLEEWLNDALQGDDGTGIREPLRTLKKYEMDKASLRNSNMSLQEIGNLYSGLFVYTNGIKNTFEEMLKCASLQSRQDHKLQKTYWRIFIKLLENTIPVKTCFQIIEDDFRRDISSLKRSLLEQKKKQDEIETIHEDSIKKLKREIEEYEKKIKEMQKEYNVMNKNLEIYEETFNEEVSLRLKFQQKINQVYSSYDELKQKYQFMRQQLSNKTEILMITQSQKQRLEDRIRDDLIRYDENIQKLEMMDLRLEERQRLLTIKNQQICDLQMVSHKDDVVKMKQETELDQLMVSVKILKKNQIQSEKKIEQYKQLMQKYENSLEKIKQTLSNAREKNDELYIELQSTNIRLNRAQNQSTRLKFQLQELKAKSLLRENKLKINEAQRDDFSCKLSKMQIQLSLKNKQILDKNKALQALSVNITELKSVKDKYERINDSLSFQVKKLRSQLENSISQLGSQQVKCLSLSVQKQTCVKMINQLQITVSYHKKTIESQQTQMQQMQVINKKALQSLKMKIKERQYDIDLLNKEINDFKELMGKKEGQTLKKYDEMAYLKKQNQLYERELVEIKDKINCHVKQSDKKDKQIEKLMKKLQGKEYTLEQKRQQINGEVTTLKNNLKMSKISLKQRSAFVHPMIYQNLLSQLARNEQRYQQYVDKTKNIHETYDSLVQQLKIIKQRNIQQKLETQKNENTLTIQVNKSKDESKALKIELQSKIKQKDNQIKKLIEQHIEKQLESHNKIDQLSQKLIKSNNQYQIVLNEIKEIKANSEKAKKKNKDESIQTEEAYFKKIEDTKTGLNSQSTQTDFQQVSNMNSSSRNMSSSIRNSQHERKTEKQDLSTSKQGQKLYDKIVDHRQKQRESLPLSSRTVVSKHQTDRPQLQQLQQQCSSIEGKQQKFERKIEGRQFKKALRLTYMRK